MPNKKKSIQLQIVEIIVTVAPKKKTIQFSAKIAV